MSGSVSPGSGPGGDHRHQSLILFACIVIGAQSSAISPFSSGGSLVLGSCSEEEERNAMFPRLLFVAAPVSVLSATAFNAVLSVVLGVLF